MRVLAIAASCAAALVSVDAVCFVANTVAGQDSFQAVNAAYVACKDNAMNITSVDNAALCTCAQNQLTQANGCSYDWISPWIATVRRDKAKFCGQSSSVSSAHSSMSGSDASIPSLGTSSDSSGPGMSKWTTAQKAIFWSIAICLILAIGGGCAFTVFKGKKKGSKKAAPPVYADEEQQYQQDEQQYRQDDQQYQQYTDAPQDFQTAPQEAAPEEYLAPQTVELPQVEVAPLPEVQPLLAQEPAGLFGPLPGTQIAPLTVAPQTFAPQTIAPQYFQAPTSFAPITTLPPQYMAQPQYATTYATPATYAPTYAQPIMGQYQ